jgi:hypothetical protein
MAIIVAVFLLTVLWLLVVSVVGWQVGSDPEIQVATVVSNHLTAGIMKYFGDSGRYQPAANLFEKLSWKDPEVASLLAKSYIGMSEYSALLPSYEPLRLSRYARPPRTYSHAPQY